MQLVAIGAQDTYLTGSIDAARTFWRQRYTRHTNFAIESIPQTFSGGAGFGERAACVLARNGDLITGVTVEVVLRKSGDTFYPAEHLLKEVTMEIGGQAIDRVTNTWLRAYDELHRDVDKREGYRYMTEFVDEGVGATKRFYVPLPFWFCGNKGQALPLISMQYHEAILYFDFARDVPGVDKLVDIRVWADYVFLDTDERRMFAQTTHEYLIEQTQVHREPVSVGATSQKHNVILPFNHPVKYLVWMLKSSSGPHARFTGAPEGLQSNETLGPLAQCGLQLNGHDRFMPRKGSYFRLNHPWTWFGRVPSVGVYAFSFAAHPSRLGPSGSLNMSRIDTARLILWTKAAVLTSSEPQDEDSTTVEASDLDILEVYARNFNVLRVMSGMAGLAFSN